MSSPTSTNRRRRGIAALTAAAVLAAVALVASSAGAAKRPPAPIETIGPAELLGSELGSIADRRGKSPTNSSGAFVYRKGRYTPLSTIPGAFDTLTTALNNRGETAGTFVDAVPGDDGQLPPGSRNGFVRDRRGGSTKFDGPGGEDVAVFGLNNRGQATGVYIDPGAVPGPDGLLPPGAVHGFIRERSGRITGFDVPFPYLHAISDINDRGETVGFYDTPSGPERRLPAGARRRDHADRRPGGRPVHLPLGPQRRRPGGRLLRRP
jgi:hypothetical protein